jgi:AMP deaminase
MSLPVRTRDEGDDEGPPTSGLVDREEPSESLVGHEGRLEDGMLLRDFEERTTFYDAVAELQMTQTEAKLFYQRSRNGNSPWPQATPFESPLILAGSRPATEYGADSLILDPDGE